jgi:hypothetical protein
LLHSLEAALAILSSVRGLDGHHGWSISLPMVGCLALARRCDQRTSLGTQNTFSARYSVRVLGSDGILRQQRGALRLEGVRDVFEKNQAERDVLVVGRFQVLA